MAGPRWVRLDVDYFRNPKVRQLPARSVLVHLAGICYSADQLTDGIITDEVLPVVLTDARARHRDVAPLLDARLWYRVDDTHVIHDFLAMQPSRATVEERRRQKAARMAKWRAEHDM